MNYIGSKFSLIDFLNTTINTILQKSQENRQTNEMIFADLFAGTGIVGATFKQQGYTVLANDIQYYSYILIKHFIENGNNLNTDHCTQLIKELNQVPLRDGFIYNNYTYSGTNEQEYRRTYFSEYNAKKCDAIRLKIDEWLHNNYINEYEYYFLLASLLNSIDKHANTASVYGAYLKKLKKSAQKEMELTPLPIITGSENCHVNNTDITLLIKEISGDILYLDPPYNTRQYCTNYHLLETIARYDNPTIKGKTGLRDYSSQKSIFCIKNKVATAFEEIIKNAKFKYIFLSYNNEGLMSFDTIENIMKKYGKYEVYSTEYHRFKADSKREQKANSTFEYLHCLVKNDYE